MIKHEHLLVRAEVNSPPMEPETVKAWFLNLIDRIGMKVLDGPHAKYLDVAGNRGMTAVAIIETSHIAMHVWDEEHPSLMQLDVYTCSSLDINIVFEELQQFDPVKIDHKFLDRETGFTEL